MISLLPVRCLQVSQPCITRSLRCSQDPENIFFLLFPCLANGSWPGMHALHFYLRAALHTFTYPTKSPSLTLLTQSGHEHIESLPSLELSVTLLLDPWSIPEQFTQTLIGVAPWTQHVLPQGTTGDGWWGDPLPMS